MPIRRDLRPLYPANWREISDRIRFGRAGGRCEQCGRPHGSSVYCLPDGRWFDSALGAWRDRNGRPVAPPAVLELDDMRVTRVVLATAHIAHDPSRSGDADLAAWCQRCHLAHDLAHHRVQRWLRYRARYAIADLFGG